MIGLGRTGANMAERLRRGGQEVIGYSRSSPILDVDSLAELVDKLAPPRSTPVMVPAGDATEGTIEELAKILGSGIRINTVAPEMAARILPAA